VLCAFGFTRFTTAAVGAPAVEPFVPDLDPHRDDNHAGAVRLRTQHSSVPQGASRYTFGTDTL